MPTETPGTPNRYHASIARKSAPRGSETRLETVYATTPENALKRLERQGLFDPRTEVATLTGDDDQIVVRS